VLHPGFPKCPADGRQGYRGYTQPRKATTEDTLDGYRMSSIGVPKPDRPDSCL